MPISLQVSFLYSLGSFLRKKVIITVWNVEDASIGRIEARTGGFAVDATRKIRSLHVGNV